MSSPRDHCYSPSCHPPSPKALSPKALFSLGTPPRTPKSLSSKVASSLKNHIWLIVPLFLTYRAVIFHSKCWSTSTAGKGGDIILHDCKCSPKSLKNSLQNGNILYQAAEKDPQAAKASLDGLFKSIQLSFGVANFEEEISSDNDDPQTLIQVRAFPRLNSSFPCSPAESTWRQYKTQIKPAARGLFYVKTQKSASNTIVGVAMRIAMKEAERQQPVPNATSEICKIRFESYPASRMEYGQRNRDKSFMFTFLAEPTARSIEMFFHYHISRAKKEPTDAAFKRYLTRLPDQGSQSTLPWPYDHYLHFLSTDGYEIGSGSQDTAYLNMTVNKILIDYDFIGIAERLDESLVAMQMMLGLKTTDILYNPATVKEQWDDKGLFIQPSFVSPGMAKFFTSETWKELSHGDYLMYLAANASLDKTIEALGRKEFDEQLALFQQAKVLIRTNCDRIVPKYSAAGQMFKTDCLYGGIGCGSRCFDRLERQLNQ